MHADSLLIQALVYLSAGVISVPIAKRLGLGSVLGYLIAGALVGPYLLNLVGEAGDVMRFAEFGVVILLFLIGLEVRPALLWQMRTSIFGLGIAQMLVSAAAIGAVVLLLGLDWRVALSMALTPIAFMAYERWVLNRVSPGAEPARRAFDDGAPDVIVAGFGRFGQIATRLLTANDFKVVLLAPPSSRST